jgi:dihydropteroate synthase
MAPSPARALRVGDRTLALGPRPLLMGIVNASPDSFSDGRPGESGAERIERARRLLADGADIIDVGGESAITGRPAVAVREEIERILPLVQQLAAEGAIVSVDTYKPAVARAAIGAGARIVNDVSGLRDPELADLCAQTGAALVLMHTAAPPKTRLQDPGLYADVRAEVRAFLRDRMALALERGVHPEQLLLDPGPDFTKTPAQTIELLQGLEEFHELGRPLLLALSRKDFVGALNVRPPSQRLAGTLAALEWCVQAGGHVFRLHDVAEARDYLTVRAALRGELEVRGDLMLAEELRHERREGR